MPACVLLDVFYVKIIFMLEISNYTKQKINLSQLVAVTDLFLKTHRKTDYLVALSLVGDTRMKKLNRLLRGVDQTTDVLSVRSEEYMGNILGEVFINLTEITRLNKYQELLAELKIDSRFRKQSRALSLYLFLFIFVHGLLHLIGYNDDSESERKKMVALGRVFMKKIIDCGIIKNINA